MCVSFFVFGSYIARWRPARSIGNSFADGWLEPALQKSGLSGGRTAEVIQTRPCSSNIGLWTLFLLVQIGSSPQYGEGCEHLRRGRRRVRIADRQRHLADRVLHRIEHRQVVGAQLERAVDRAVGVDRRVAPVGRDHVVQVRLRVGPVPLRDDDVALDALRPRRRRRHFAAAMRSVQSANIASARSRPELFECRRSCCRRPGPTGCAAPTRATDVGNVPSAAGISRVALLPS